MLDNGEIVNNSTASRRQLNFEGLAEYVSVNSQLFFGFGFCMAFGIDFL